MEGDDEERQRHQAGVDKTKRTVNKACIRYNVRTKDYCMLDALAKRYALYIG